MTRLPELMKRGTVKTASLVRHPLPSRIPLTIGFQRKTTQTRKIQGRARIPALRLRPEPQTARRSASAKARREPGSKILANDLLDLRATRSMPLLRTGAIPVAKLRGSAGQSVSESLRRKEDA